LSYFLPCGGIRDIDAINDAIDTFGDDSIDDIDVLVNIDDSITDGYDSIDSYSRNHTWLFLL